MRHNITLSKVNSDMLKELCRIMGLKPSAVVAQALRELKRREASMNSPAHERTSDVEQ